VRRASATCGVRGAEWGYTASVRFLRMLSNAAIAAALGSAYLTVVVLHLNAGFPLRPGAVLPLALVMLVAYGTGLTAVFYGMILVRQLFAAEIVSPGWISVRLLSWLCTLAAGMGAVVMWLNVQAFGAVLDEPTVARMTAAVLTLTGSAMVFLLIAIARGWQRGGAPSAALLTVLMTISIAAPMAARGRSVGRPPATVPVSPVSAGFEAAQSGGRVIVLALDGATLDVISPAVAEGRLPNFGRIVDGGAVLHLATLRPTQPEPVWAAAATGRLPLGNGVRASARYRTGPDAPAVELLPGYCFAHALVHLGLLRQEAHDASSLRARPLWSVLSDAGLTVAVIGFPLTHPAPAVNGLLVSDELHRLGGDEFEIAGPSAVAPRSIFASVRAALRFPPVPDPTALVATAGETPTGDADERPDPAPLAADRMHLQMLTTLEQATTARFVAARFPGLDAVGHYFLRYANPSAFGDVSDDERRQYGRVLGEYYNFLDEVIGRSIDSLEPDDLLLVVSGFGMEPLSPGKRVLEWMVGNARLSGTHDRAPDGFLLAYGSTVAPGRPRRASILDLTPTVLYYLALPVARDMDGIARTDLFQESFTASRPITFIPSYGS
jgi:hypothetical protein